MKRNKKKKKSSWPNINKDKISVVSNFLIFGLFLKQGHVRFAGETTERRKFDSSPVATFLNACINENKIQQTLTYPYLYISLTCKYTALFLFNDSCKGYTNQTNTEFHRELDWSKYIRDGRFKR